MPRVTKKFRVMIALLGLGLLFCGLFIGGILPRTTWHVPTFLKAAAHVDAATLTSGSRATNDSGLLLWTNGESISQVFAIARENRITFIRDSVANLPFLRVTLILKQSSHIAKSVLNL
jgi:hypothetical protein